MSNEEEYHNNRPWVCLCVKCNRFSTLFPCKMSPIEIKKSQENIIADKDTEIYKLKKEIEELKKFYINS